MEETHGSVHLRRLLDVLRQAYLSARASVPLLRATDSFAAYRKGPFARHALRQYVGEERVNAALRRLLKHHHSGAPPLPTSLDLYEALQAATPDSLRPLLADLFERNTFWELEAEKAHAERTDGGQWRVSLDVRGVNSVGVETERPMNDWVEIGIFAPARENGERQGKPLYLQKHRIQSGQQRIVTTVPQKPARAGIDPRHLLIDTETADNTIGVETRVEK